jgi:hypothetical protein
MPGQQIDPKILRRVDRAETAMAAFEPRWREALSFFDNEQYVEVSAVTGELDRLERREGGSKPRSRPRLTRNRYTAKITEEIALLQSRVPAYECQPINGDPQPVAAARLGDKALSSLHVSLDLAGVTQQVLVYTANCGQAFSFPYWNGYEGTVLDVNHETGAVTATGCMEIAVLAPWEVLYDGGTQFEKSGFWCIKRARPVEEVREEFGLKEHELKPDAVGLPGERGEAARDLVFVYEWLRKPHDKNADGEWLCWANNRQLREQDAYPGSHDDMVIHELAWIRRPHRHRPLGAGEQMVDIQRTFNRTINQIVAWQNLVLNPKILAAKGQLLQDPTDKAGEVIEFRPMGTVVPQWQPVPDIPQGLFVQLDRCISDFEEICGRITENQDTNSASHVQALNEREMTRRGLVIKNLVRWYSSQGMHLLRLAKEYWTDDQILALQGRFGVSLIEGFRGTQLEGIAQVTVSETSLSPRTRASQEAKIMQYAQMGWIEPHQAMAALNAGTAEAIIDEYELDIARQHEEIMEMLQIGEVPVPDTIGELSSDDPEAAHKLLEQHLIEQAPPVEEFDNHAIHLDILRQYMKTSDWTQQTDAVKGILRSHYMLHEQALKGQQLEQQMQLVQAGAMKGNAGAAGIPQSTTGVASQPSMESQKSGLT